MVHGQKHTNGLQRTTFRRHILGELCPFLDQDAGDTLSTYSGPRARNICPGCIDYWYCLCPPCRRDSASIAACSMMEIGNFCRDPPGVNPQCEREERAHFGLWCIMSSPLVLVGCCVPPGLIPSFYCCLMKLLRDWNRAHTTRASI